MDNKKIFVIVALALLAIVAVGSVSALDLGFLGGNDDQDTAAEDSDAKTTTIKGIEFNIPDGYVKAENYTLDGETRSSGSIDYKVYQEGYEKGATDAILFLIGEYPTNITDDMLKTMDLGEPKTINDHDGYITTSNEGGDTFTVFFYAEDGDLVTVTVTDDSLLEEIIK